VHNRLVFDPGGGAGRRAALWRAERAGDSQGRLSSWSGCGAGRSSQNNIQHPSAIAVADDFSVVTQAVSLEGASPALVAAVEEFLLGERMRLRRKREVADAASNTAQLAAATALVVAAPDAAAGAFPLKTSRPTTSVLRLQSRLILFIIPRSSEPRCFRAAPDALCGCSAPGSKRPSAAVDAIRGAKRPVQSRDLRIVLTLQARRAAGSARRCPLRGRHSSAAARRRSRSGSGFPPAAARRSWRGWGCYRLGQSRYQSVETSHSDSIRGYRSDNQWRLQYMSRLGLLRRAQARC